MLALIRQSIYSRLAGYEDTNDAERLAVDRSCGTWLAGVRPSTRSASTSQSGEIRDRSAGTRPGIWRPWRTSLANGSIGLRDHRQLREVILDIGQLRQPRPTENRRARPYNGHFGCTCYHPLFVSTSFGDVERSILREGNVHSAKDWREVLEPVVARYRDLELPCRFRADAHSPSGTL